MIDLHFHSVFSDGDCTPEELATMGRKQGLAAMILTDHDTTEGVARFLAACTAEGMAAASGTFTGFKSATTRAVIVWSSGFGKVRAIAPSADPRHAAASGGSPQSSCCGSP